MKHSINIKYKYRVPIFTNHRRLMKGQVKVGDKVQRGSDVGLVVNWWSNHKNEITTVDVLWGESKIPQSVSQFRNLTIISNTGEYYA